MSIRQPWIVFAAALLPAAPAAAVGFGDIVLHSRVGEPLRAEVPILSEPGEEVASLCYSLAPLAGSDLPVISTARTRLVRSGNRNILQITGSKPVGEPIFLIGLRAGCGADLQRDYVLMPAEPVVFVGAGPVSGEPPVASAATASATAVRKGPTSGQQLRASEGETLDGIAETLVPDDLAQQRRMLAALKRANPKLAGKAAIPEGTQITVPDLRRRVAAERDALPEQQAEATRDIARPAAPAEPPRRTVRPPAPKPKAAGPDRVTLGAPPADVAGAATPPPKGSRAELDERMQKLEATIQSLNTQIEALDKALALTTESIALQQKLQAAQKAAEPATVAAPLAAPAAPPPPASGGGWLEILTAAFAGGVLAAVIAYLLGRRDRSRDERDIPLAMAVPAALRSNMPAPAGTVATPPATGEPSVRPDDLQAREIILDEDESAIALAEIMLSFGRPEAAAQTLAQYIEEHAPDNPRPWLLLLDLYRRARLRAEYARLAPRLKERFNLYVAPWDDIGSPAPGLQSLEEYAHITGRISATWGTPECAEYLRSLVRETRHGERGGFPLEVIEEILLLLHTLEAGYNLPAAARTAA
ncbi:MAG: hypothetical protein FIB06_06255 [Betaproteobacteria bacterium]|nr:hypothetical protein [Betaproteobacteria bacterium]